MCVGGVGSQRDQRVERRVAELVLDALAPGVVEVARRDGGAARVAEALPVLLELAETGTGPGVKDTMKANAEKLRDTLAAITAPKDAAEAKWVRFALESKLRANAEEKAKLAKALEPLTPRE